MSSVTEKVKTTVATGGKALESEGRTEQVSAFDLPEEERFCQCVRIVEALLFASDTPLAISDLIEMVPDLREGHFAVEAILTALEAHYEGRGIELFKLGESKLLFRTAPDLAFLLRRYVQENRKLSRAAVETLAIIAYRQPVTRAEIEDIRGVTLSKGTLDALMEAGWVKTRGRRRTPGRPMTYGTTEDFLIHFGLEGLDALPGFGEMKAAGLLDGVDESLTKLPGLFGTEDEEEDQLDLEQMIAEEQRQAEFARDED